MLPEGPKMKPWGCQSVPKWCQVRTSGIPGGIKVSPPMQKSRLGQHHKGPCVLRDPFGIRFWRVWECNLMNSGMNARVFCWASVRLCSGKGCVSASATRIGGTGRKAITMRRGRALPCRQRRARSHITSCQRHADALQRKKEKENAELHAQLYIFFIQRLTFTP